MDNPLRILKTKTTKAKGLPHCPKAKLKKSFAVFENRFLIEILYCSKCYYVCGISLIKDLKKCPREEVEKK